MRRALHWTTVVAPLVLLNGCGTYVPEMQNFWEDRNEGLLRVDRLKDHVSCEVISSIQSVLANNEQLNQVRLASGLRSVDLDDIKSWTAEVLLTLTVEEKSQFNPSVSINDVYPNASRVFRSGSVVIGQNSSIGLAGQSTSAATKKITYAYGIELRDYFVGPRSKKLAAAAQKGVRCADPGGTFTDGDLKFKDTLESVLVPAASNNTDDNAFGSDFFKELKTAEEAIKKDAIAHQVTFIVLYGASINPTIKFVDVSASQGSGPFLGVQRTNTNDVSITMGPKVDGQLNPIVTSTILSSQITNGARSAIQSLRN